MQETWVLSLDQEDPLEKGMAIHSGIRAWRIQGTEESAGLQSTGLQTVRHIWVTKQHLTNCKVDSITPAFIKKSAQLHLSCASSNRPQSPVWSIQYISLLAAVWVKHKPKTQIDSLSPRVFKLSWEDAAPVFRVQLPSTRSQGHDPTQGRNQVCSERLNTERDKGEEVKRTFTNVKTLVLVLVQEFK